MVVVFCITILLLLVLAVCIYCFHTCFYAANKKPLDPYSPLRGSQFLTVQDKIYASTRRLEAVPYESVTTKSFDGLTLAAQYYHVADGAPVTIIFHGYRSMALRDCTGGFGIATRLGMNVLAVDQRAHGHSQGHVITFGIKERRDCLSWIEYINNRFGADTPISLYGLSMGAATVLMASALPFPKNVVCILADCPYSSPAEIIKKVCKDEGYPPKLVYPLIRFAARVFGGFNLEECSAVEAVKDATIPIQLLHGEDDRFVPCQMSCEIHEASKSNIKLATFPNAGHGLSYMTMPVEYENTVFSFLASIPALQSYVDKALFDKATQ